MPITWSEYVITFERYMCSMFGINLYISGAPTYLSSWVASSLQKPRKTGLLITLILVSDIMGKGMFVSSFPVASIIGVISHR